MNYRPRRRVDEALRDQEGRKPKPEPNSVKLAPSSNPANMSVPLNRTSRQTQLNTALESDSSRGDSHVTPKARPSQVQHGAAHIQSNSFPGRPLPKWVLLPPANRLPLNKRLDVPGFFPFHQGVPEEKLTPTTIEQGYKESVSSVDDEYGSMREEFSKLMKDNQLKEKIFSSLHNIAWSKETKNRKYSSLSVAKEVNRSVSSALGTRKQTFFPELMTFTTEQKRQEWLKRLSATDERLRDLVENSKVPQCSKIDDLLNFFAEQKTPFVRATWYIKICYLNMFYNPSVQKQTKENAYTHWTTTITSHLIKQMKDFYGKSSLRRSSTHNVKTLTTHDKKKLKLNYIMKLLYWTYREGLVDRDLLLTSLIDELLQSTKIEHQILLLFVLIQYLEEIFVHYISWSKLLEYCQSKLIMFTPSLVANSPSPNTETNTSGGRILSVDSHFSGHATGNSNGSPTVSPTGLTLLGIISNILRYALIYEPNLLGTLNSEMLSLIERTLLIFTCRADDLCTNAVHSHHHNPQIDLIGQPNNLLLNSSPLLLMSKESFVFMDTTEEICKQNLWALKKRANAFEELINISQPSTVPLLEALDAVSKTKDIDFVYKTLVSDYGVFDENQRTDFGILIHTLCEWTLTQHRKDFFRIYIAVSLLRRLHSELSTARNIKYPLQQSLLSFLDNVRNFTHLDDKQLIRFFGELIRWGIFSHDSYVRNLISRGILERRDRPDWQFHRSLLEQLPLFKEAKHERKQRKICLQKLGKEDEDAILDEGLCRINEYFSHPSDSTFQNIATFLAEISLYCRSHLIELFIERFKRAVEEKACEEISIGTILQLLERYEDYTTLANTLVWLVSTPHYTLYVHLIPYIQQYEFLLFCLGMMFTVLNALQAKYDLNLTNAVEVRITSYLVNFLRRNGNLSVTKQWLNKTKLHEKLKRRIALDAEKKPRLSADSEMNPNDYALIRTALNSLSLLDADVHTHQSNHSLPSLTQPKISLMLKNALESLKLIPFENCIHFLTILFENIQYLWPRLKGVPLQKLQHHIFGALLWELRANFTTLNDESHFAKALYEVLLQQIHCILQNDFDYNKLLPFFAFLSVLLLNNFIQLDQFLTDVFVPLLQELEPKDVKISPPSLYRLLVQLLLIRWFLQEKQLFSALEIFSSQERQSLLLLCKSQTLDTIFPILSTVFKMGTALRDNNFIDSISQTEFPLLQSVKTSFESLQMHTTFISEICLDDTVNLYSKLKTLRDPIGVREIFHIFLLGDTHYLRFHTKESIENTEVIKHIYHMVKSVDQWTYPYRWLEIRLFLDEIWYLTNRKFKLKTENGPSIINGPLPALGTYNNSNSINTGGNGNQSINANLNNPDLISTENYFVNVLFWSLTESPHQSFVYQKLITLMGPEIHKASIAFAQRLLESMDLMNGNFTLLSCIRTLSGNFDLLGHRSPQESSDVLDIQFSDELTLLFSFSQVVISTLYEASSGEQKANFIKSLQTQIKHLEKIVTQQNWTEICQQERRYLLLRLQIFLRVRFVGALLIGAAKTDPVKGDSTKLVVSQNIIEEIATSFLQLLSCPLVQSDLLEDGLELWNQILLVLNALTTEGGSNLSLNSTVISTTRKTLTARGVVPGTRYEQTTTPTKRRLQEQYRQLKFPPLLQSKLEQTLPFLTANFNSEFLKLNVSEAHTSSDNSTFIEPWTVLEDYDEANLLRYFNCKKIERKPQSESESLVKQLPPTTDTMLLTADHQLSSEVEKQSKKRHFESISEANNNIINRNNNAQPFIPSNTIADDTETIPVKKKLKQETSVV
jgi:hypothetical protein